jgi:pimeloyl-ACP methyl ester carboxylesterase
MEKRIRLTTHSVNVQFIGSDHGQNRKPVLIFLHEALGSIVQWKQFPADLCRIAELPGIVIERQGHGKSDPLTAPRTENYLHEYTFELNDVLPEVLPLNTPVILVGHSDGGTIALLYAALFPKNVKAIVTMAAHVFVEPETLAGIDPAVAAWKNGKLDGLKRIHGEKTGMLFHAWADTWRAEFFRSWNITGEITGVSCPALILQGTGDQYGTDAQVTAIAQAIPDAETVLIKDCGHHPHLEKPAEVLEAAGAFLSAGRFRSAEMR